MIYESDVDNDRRCYIRAQSPRLTCELDGKVIFQSPRREVAQFNAQELGFVLQSKEDTGRGRIYTYLPGPVTCTSI